MSFRFKMLMAACVATALSSCYQAQYANCVITCASDDQCPSGGTCTAMSNGTGVCAHSGATCEAQPDASTPDAPVDAPPAVTWKSVDVGAGFVCAITTSQRLYCWGDNRVGQAGAASPAFVTAPTEVQVGGQARVGWTAVSTGNRHACGLLKTASATDLYCWGANDQSQVGPTTTGPTQSLPPTQVDAAKHDFRQVSVARGGDSTCVVDAADKATCWGDNRNGQLSATTLGASQEYLNGGTTSAAKAVAAGGSHTCTLNAMSKVTCFGNGPGKGNDMVGALTNIVELSAGRDHTCARDNQDVVRCWGANRFAELGTTGPQAAPVRFTAMRNYTAIGAGAQTTCGLRAGVLDCAGANTFGQIGDGAPLNSNRRLPATRVATVVGADGVAPLAGIVSFAAGGRLDSLYTPRLPISGTPPIAGAPALDFDYEATANVCAIDTQGALYCWGDNDFGQLGNGRRGAADVPKLVTKPTGYQTWKQVVVGEAHTCAVASNGTRGDAFCWGRNLFGESGQGDAVHSVTAGPALVTLPNAGRSVESASSTKRHTCLSLNPVGFPDVGQAVCFGNNLVTADENGDRQAGGVITADAVPQHFDAVNFGLSAGNTAANHTFDHVVAGDGQTCGLTRTSFGDIDCLPAKPNGYSCLIDTANFQNSFDNQAPIMGFHSFAFLTLTQLGTGNKVNNFVCNSNDARGFDGSGPYDCGEGGLRLCEGNLEQSRHYDSFATGRIHSCGIDSGTLRCWGNLESQQLGAAAYNENRGVLNPTPGWRSVAVGQRDTCAINQNGKVYCFGNNNRGQLGKPLNVATAGYDDAAPTLELANFCAVNVAISARHACAVMQAGTLANGVCTATAGGNTELYCWGSNSNGQVSPLGAGSPRAQKLAAPLQ